MENIMKVKDPQVKNLSLKLNNQAGGCTQQEALLI